MTHPPRRPGRRLATSLTNLITTVVIIGTLVTAPIYLVSNPELFGKVGTITAALWLIAKLLFLGIIAILLLVIGIGLAGWMIENHHEYGWLTTGRVPFTRESDVGKPRRCHNCRQKADGDEGVVTGKEITSGKDTVVMGFLINRDEQTNRFDCMECYEADPVTYSLREENPGYRPEEDGDLE